MIRHVLSNSTSPRPQMTLILTLVDPLWPIFFKTNEKLSEVCLTWARQNYLSWFNNVDNKVRIALRAPLLIRCPETKKFYVNYDPEIDKILREAKYFERIGQQFEHAKGTVQNAISKINIFDLWPWPYRFWTIVRRIPTSPRRQRSFAKKGWSQKCQDSNGNVPQDIQCWDCQNPNHFQATLRKTREGCSFEDQQG